MSLKHFFLIITSLFLFNCKSAKITKKVYKKMQTDFYKNQFTGILVYNPVTKDTILKYNAHKYFTPASNTKIFTLYAALKTLPQKVIAYKYQLENDTLFIRGVGNPTFLHPFFKDSTALFNINKHVKTYVTLQNNNNLKFGSGWAWEDYDTYFSPERSVFPMYGNVLTVFKKNNRIYAKPKVLAKEVSLKKQSKFRRDYAKNKFYYPPERKDTLQIPMLINTQLIQKLWQYIAPNKVIITNFNQKTPHIAFTNVFSDSLYQRMMHKSDNFLAEQILLMASSTLSDTLNFTNIKKHMFATYLKDLQEPPRWVDGSGLSRYNLFTPTSFVQVLEKMYDEIETERLFYLFPTGGKTGTLKKWYAGNPEPYVFAKSGTLGNNYSLSGYLKTASGKILIFSFMNNHYRKSTLKVKKQMQEFFEYIRDHY